MDKPYFKSDSKFIYLERPYCEFYIPMDYFDNSGHFAEDRGQTVNTLGVFIVQFFENGKPTDVKTMNVPTWITLFVYDSDTVNIKLPGSQEKVPCKVLKYFKGNKVMESTVVEDSENAQTYLKFITQGKIPKTVPYSKTNTMWRKNQSMNGVNLGVPAVMEELILSVSYRNKSNPGEKFAYVIGKNPDVSEYDYITASVRQICQYASTFTALTFEDIDSMITTSLNRSRDHRPEAESPVEQIIKM